MAPKCKRVAVIGAGISGLAATKTCLEEGIDVITYESRPKVGGIWSDTRDGRDGDGPGMYRTLTTNSSKSMTCFSDFPCPASYPPYIPHRLFEEYLESYAKHFDLTSHIQLNTRVLRINRSPDHDTTGRWAVVTEDKDGNITEGIFDGVIVAAGFYSKAWKPQIKGIEDFTGEMCHVNAYKEAIPYTDKTVLVIGNGSSAGDIATDVTSRAKQVYLSVGSGLVLLNRTTPDCLPADLGLKRIFLELLSWETLWALGQSGARSKFDHRRSGLLYDGKRAIDCLNMVNDDLPSRIMMGKVKIIPEVNQFTHDGFWTKETRDVDATLYRGIDAVIFATGYTRELAFLDPSVDIDGERLKLYNHIFPIYEKHHTLALVGCVRPSGANPPTLELQARMAAYTLSGRYKLPTLPKMIAKARELEAVALKPKGMAQYSAFFSVVMSDILAKDLGVKPQFWKLLLSGRPKLAWRCFFGPFVPFHYRLQGPGQWDGAPDAIARVYDENLTSLKYRGIAKEEGRGFKGRLWICMKLSIFVGIVYIGCKWTGLNLTKYLSNLSL